jgi:hypothetical protein
MILDFDRTSQPAGMVMDEGNQGVFFFVPSTLSTIAEVDLILLLSTGFSFDAFPLFERA